MSVSPARGARVRLLPPLVFLVPLGVGVLLGRVAPWSMPAVAPWDTLRTVAGWGLAAAGVALMTWAAAVMWRHRTTVVPWARVDHLVTHGPFARSRNPIYLADVLLYLGLTLVAGTWWPLLLLPLPVLVVRWLVIAREEDYLTGRFPEAYAAYRARVRRWL